MSRVLWLFPFLLVRLLSAGAEFDEFAASAMKDWNVPGLALAVVKDGAVIHSNTYGYRDLKQRLPVTPKTLFGIGSITKSVTVLAMSSLVEQGKLDWDRPVREYLPDFRLWDPLATERATPRDLVTHRTGLPRHDGVWFNSPFSREQMVRSLRYLEPSKDFRTAYQYNNLMFMTAGYLAGRIAGESWEDLARRRVIEPAGMRSANFSVRDSRRSPDYAVTYAEVKGKLEETPLRILDALGPAGSINASLEDMARYLLYHLKDSAAGLKEMRRPQTLMPPSAQPEYEGFGTNSYGMGLFLTTYRGHELVYHTGTIGGYHALLSYLPKERIGVVMLLNRVARPLPQILSLKIYDRLLNLPPIERTRAFKDAEQKQNAAEEKTRRASEARRKPGTRPSHPLTEYAGRFEHPAYGILEIQFEAGGLILRRNTDTAPLSHYHYDVFETPDDGLSPYSGFKVQFLSSVDGEIDRAAIKLEPAVQEIVFTRKAR
jgi:CubicO group peptidase (beta-lactamase class C family)